MERITLTILGLLALLGQQEPPRAAAGEKEEGFVVRYVLPATQPATEAKDPTRRDPSRPDPAAVSDLSALVYGEARILQHVRHTLLREQCVDGACTYTILTPKGKLTYSTGMDEMYLGRTFRAEDMVAFLQRRLHGETAVREFRITDPNLVAAYHERKKLGEDVDARLAYSPWDRDTLSIIRLLGGAKYTAALPVFNDLTKDRVAAVRTSAVYALGSIATEAPKAIDDIKRLLKDKELQTAAVGALSNAGKAAVPALIEAMDHPDAAVRRAAVGRLPWMPLDTATPVLLVGLRHRRAEIREGAAVVTLDIQSRGKRTLDEAIVDALAPLLSDPNRDTRRRAAIALLNFGPAARKAAPALKAAVERPDDPDVQKYAGEALRAIEKSDTKQK